LSAAPSTASTLRNIAQQLELDGPRKRGISLGKRDEIIRARLRDQLLKVAGNQKSS